MPTKPPLTLETVLTDDLYWQIRSASLPRNTTPEQAWRAFLVYALAPWEQAIEERVTVNILDDFEASFGEDGDVGLIEVRRWLEVRHVHRATAKAIRDERQQAIRADERAKVLAERRGPRCRQDGDHFSISLTGDK